MTIDEFVEEFGGAFRHFEGAANCGSTRMIRVVLGVYLFCPITLVVYRKLNRYVRTGEAGFVGGPLLGLGDTDVARIITASDVPPQTDSLAKLRSRLVEAIS